MVWEQPGVTGRCSLLRLLCNQRERFKQNAYQAITLSQLLCFLQTRHSSAQCQHLPNGFWIVILIFRNPIILFRKTICLLALLYNWEQNQTVKPASHGPPQTAPEMLKDEHIRLAQLCWNSWPKRSIYYRVWLSSYLLWWLHCCSAEILGGPWGHHERSAPGAAENIKKWSIHMPGLVDCDQLVQSCGNHRASCNP